MAENEDPAALSPPTHSSNVLSPPRLPPSKEKRLPSITPRKFKRFFTPRSRVSSQPSAARRALRDLTAPALNRAFTPSSPLKASLDSNGLGDALEGPAIPVSKRRKFHHTPESSPLKPESPLHVSFSSESTTHAKVGLLSPIQSLPSSQATEDLSDLDDADSIGLPEHDIPPADRLVPLTHRGLGAQVLQRQFGGMPHAGRHFMSCPVADWRSETANFYSKPTDTHFCTSHEGAPRCIPFCTAACHTNSMVAVGDEEGRVRLLDSSDRFDKIHIAFQSHGNAIIDLAFSDDDYLLATASGDQTGKVIDMMTQTPVSILGHHTASLKQVRFQPGKGSGSVLATSSRDGSVQIWDLRCKGGPVQELAIERDSSLRFRAPRQVSQGCVVNSIYDAHVRTQRQTRQQQQSMPHADVASRGEVPGRIGEVSVTAIQFLPAGREHLLLSACEADASIKLWDIRSIHTSRHKTSSPVSSTAPPDSHTAWRPFGISSMSLSTDGARLYSLCKDNTVYAYSSAHLILGHAPELSSKTDHPRRRYGFTQEGLGPIYGFRHPQFHATSFYVKSALRPAKDGRSELLAVGSSDGCAVLFPTDERYFKESLEARRDYRPSHACDSTFTASQARGGRDTRLLSPALPRPGLFRTNSVSNFSGRLVDTIPIIRTGTPLIRGHEKEVGALDWTNDGSLVTIGDDYMVRCWAEDQSQAADLRTGGEAEGRRWGCGWADVGSDWDDDGW
ncbi:WD repeat protein [Pleurostoma richardsiae]|uniref:WD repeat protein n=1 Tax=Pleurostoma richardsiae TaxID=41990 RepID=A0AA38RHG8_9PEZI|nr:WD repeat protein [Pleurostoma richardsiae]